MTSTCYNTAGGANNESTVIIADPIEGADAHKGRNHHMRAHHGAVGVGRDDSNREAWKRTREFR